MNKIYNFWLDRELFSTLCNKYRTEMVLMHKKELMQWKY